MSISEKKKLPPAFILSLSNAKERRALASSQLKRHDIDFRFVDAIDGKAMSYEDIDRAYDPEQNKRKFKRALSRGEIACALSHRMIWKIIADGRDLISLICEDDLEIISPINDFLSAVAEADSLLEDVMIKIDGAARGGEILGRIKDVELCLSSSLPPRTTAYLLGRGAARRLLEKSSKIARPVDMDIKHYWEHGIPVLTTRPQLVAERSAALSSLEQERSSMKPSQAIIRGLRNLHYQLRMHMARRTHSLQSDTVPSLVALKTYCSSVREVERFS